MKLLVSLGLMIGLSSCVTLKQDYGNFKAHKPQSILVLPPLNETVEVEASGTYLSVITYPIAEKGYYVYPVTLVERFMKQNGLPSPAEMHSVDPKKLHEIFGADAALYVSIEEWGNKFEVISSTTKIKARAKLVDLKTGKVLWNQQQIANNSSGNSQGGLVGMVVEAAISQVIKETVDQTRVLAKGSTFQLIHHRQIGFLDGPLKKKGTGKKKSLAH